MSQVELHNAIVDIRAQVYALETLVARLYVGIACGSKDPQACLDTAFEAVKRDINAMILEPPYTPETAKEMRAKIHASAARVFSGMVT